MPKTTDNEILQRLGIRLQPPGTYARRAQNAGLLDDRNSITPPDTSSLLEEPTSLFDSNLSLGDEDITSAPLFGSPRDRALADSLSSGEPEDVLSAPLFSQSPSADPLRGIEMPHMNLKLAEGQPEPTRREAAFAIDDLLAQQDRALAIAEQKGYSDKRKSLIRQRFKRAIDKLKDIAEPKPEPFLTEAERNALPPTWGGILSRAVENPIVQTLFVRPVPGAEKLGDVIAGDPRQGQRDNWDKAIDVATAVTNPIPSIFGEGIGAAKDVYRAATGNKPFLEALEEAGDKRASKSITEKGQDIREFTGDVVGSLTPVDAIMAILTAGESAVASGALKAGTTGARMAAIAPGAFRASGAIQALGSAGEALVGSRNVVQGLEEGDYGQAAHGAFQAALAGLGFHGARQSWIRPSSPDVLAQKALLRNEQNFPPAVQIGELGRTIREAPENLAITDDVLKTIQTDARFGGSMHQPLDADLAWSHAKAIQSRYGDEALTEIAKSPVMPSDQDLMFSAIEQRNRVQAAARAAASGGQMAPQSAEEKLLATLSVGRQISEENAALARATRSQRFAMMERDIAENPTVEGIAGARGRLAGEMPRSQTPMPQLQLSPQETNEIANRIMQSDLTVVEKSRAADVLVKLAQDTPIPPSASDIDLLEKVLGTKVARAMQGAPRNVFKSFAAALYNLPRSIMASFDLSGMRQGFVATARHPVKGFRAFYEALGPAFKKVKYEDAVDEFITDPLYTVAKDSGLHFGSVGERIQAGRMVPGEDIAFSELAGKIPGVTQSQRHYTLFLDKLRFDVFKDHAEKMLKMGVNPVSDPETFKAFAGLANIATGRGPLSKLEPYAKQLGHAFWSPRLLASRLALLNPRYYAQLPEPVREEAFKTLFAATGASVGMLSLLSQTPGVKVEWDPRSTDFGKVQIGKTRISLMAGHEGYLQLFAKLMTRQYISQAEQLRQLTGETPDPSRSEILIRFLRGKMAPVPNFIIDAMKGRDFTGRKFDASESLWEMVRPMSGSDWVELMKQEGFALPGYEDDPTLTGGWDTSKFTLENVPQAVKNTAKWLPGFFGMNVQTYAERKQSQRAERAERRSAAKEKARLDARKRAAEEAKKLGYNPLFEEKE